MLPDELCLCPPYITDANISACQLELIDIQSNDMLKRLHSTSVSALVFWQSVHQNNLRMVAKNVLSMLGSIYCCEQTFSIMNSVKSKLRKGLTVEHTSELIKAAVTNIDPDFDLLVNNMQLHPCLLYTSPSPRDGLLSRMPSSA